MNMLSIQVISKVVNEVPEYTEFMTVDELYESSFELARKHKDIVEILEIGTSRSKDPIYALRIGDGENLVLAFAFPHPNEPVGSLTLEFLTWKFAEDRDLLKLTRSTFLVVKVADVFGARLNEGWFKGSFNIKKYALNYYRPPGYKQVEWTFPVEYKGFKWNKPTNETKALMKLIDEYKPDVIYSLHNAGFTGVYYYLSRPLPKVYRGLKEFPRKLGVPIHLGEPETPYMKKLDDAIFKMPSFKDQYDFLEEHLKDKKPSEVIKYGGSSYDYALRYKPDVLEVVCEVPYLYDWLLEDTKSIGVLRRDVILYGLSKHKELLSLFDYYIEKLQPYTDYENPFFESICEFTKLSKDYIKAEEEWARKDPSLMRAATIAEVFDSLTLGTYWSSILRLGLLYRAINHTISTSKETSRVLKPLRDEVLRRLDEFINVFKKVSKYEVIPVKKLVQIQLYAVLTTLSYAKE